jgi:hypothetical protein
MATIFRRTILSAEYHFKESESFYPFILFCASLDVGKESSIGAALALTYAHELAYVHHSENHPIKIYVYKHLILVLMFF